MAETAQTMTEFTYAPGEKNIVGDRFSPSVIIFWLKTSIAASSTRVQYKAPNTLFGLIPLGASTKTIPLRNIASVDTNTRFNLGSLVWGLIFLFVGFGMFNSNALVAIVCLLVAAANLANVMSASLVFHDPSGGANAITVSILEKDKLMKLAQEIQARVFTDADQLRHEESMHMAEKQYTAQTNSVLIQQQMLANQQAQAVQQAPTQSEQTSRASDIIRKPETGTGTKKLNRTPIVRTEEIQIRRSGCGPFICVRFEGDVTTTDSGVMRWNSSRPEPAKTHTTTTPSSPGTPGRVTSWEWIRASSTRTPAGGGKTTGTGTALHF